MPRRYCATAAIKWASLGVFSALSELPEISTQMPTASMVSALVRAPAHQAGVRERHARAHFACGQTLADFCKVCTIKVSRSRGSLRTSITTVLILTFAGIAGLRWPGTAGFVLSCSAQSMVKDFEQSHLISPKMQTKLEISRQAELFPSSGFFQADRKS